MLCDKQLKKTQQLMNQGRALRKHFNLALCFYEDERVFQTLIDDGLDLGIYYNTTPLYEVVRLLVEEKKAEIRC